MLLATYYALNYAGIIGRGLLNGGHRFFCIEWLYQFFTRFTTMCYLQDHPLTKQSTTKFPTILDGEYTIAYMQDPIDLQLHSYNVHLYHHS